MALGGGYTMTDRSRQALSSSEAIVATVVARHATGVRGDQVYQRGSEHARVVQLVAAVVLGCSFDRVC